MSNSVYPTLEGLTWGVLKTPRFNTIIQASVSGKELRASTMAYPVYTFKLKYEFLKLADLKVLMGFFNLRRGAWDNFLFSDPNDNNVIAQNIGTGNGSTTKFQLTRTYGSFTEPVMNVNGTANIYVNGVLKTLGGDYTIDSLGMITFASAPIAAASITWTGTYYFRCRFVNDESEFENFMYNLWSHGGLELVGSLGSKI
jgi:uncharacterized protein (TIGR02217 family)